MIDSGNTLMMAARTLKEKGAKSVHALISHGMRSSWRCVPLFIFMCFLGLLSETNLSLVEQLPLKELVVRISKINLRSPHLRLYTSGDKYHTPKAA